MPDFSFLREFTRKGQAATIEHAQVSVPASAWTTVVSLTTTEQRKVTAFGADLAAVLSTTYRFRLLLDGVVKWSEVAGTTSIGFIPVHMNVPTGSTVEVQVFHGEASATNADASISHVTA